MVDLNNRTNEKLDESLKKNLQLNFFLFIILYSIVSVLIIIFVNQWIIRLLTVPLFFFLLGYPLSYFIPNLNSWERAFLSFGLSSLMMLLIYYFEYITSFYLALSPSFLGYVLGMVIFIWITILILYLTKRDIFLSKQINLSNIITDAKEFLKKNRYILLIALLTIILRFTFLNFSDFATDDTIFIVGSYPNIDTDNVMGLPSPPFQYLSGHHPPIFHLQANIMMNLLNPYGWVFMQDWMGKFLPAFIGVLAVIFCYGVVKNIYNQRSAYIAALFFSVCTFAVVLSQVFYQEGLLILLIGLVFYFAYKERWGLTGFFVGVSLLVKFSALVLIPGLIVYIAIRYLRFNFEKFKLLLKHLTNMALIILILYLPIFIANVATYFEFGYADSFWSRLFGLSDPMTEAVGDVEIPLYGVEPGLFSYFSFEMMGLINVFGIILFIFLIICVFFSFFDKKEHLKFNIALISFISVYLLVFTTRMFQIITLSPIIFPLAILASRASIIIKSSNTNVKTKAHYNKQKIMAYGLLIFVFGFSTIYSINTVAIDHSDEIVFDAGYQVRNPAYYYSNLGYMWISRYGYDDVLQTIRDYPTYDIYIDNDHPRFSYIYYFWIRNYTLFISDWNYQNDSLFIIYKFPNNIWEAFQYSTEDDNIEDYIKANYTLVLENDNFEVYISN